MQKQNAKRLTRDLMAKGLWAAGITRPSRRARGRLSIATFHRVLPVALRDQYPFPGLCVTPEELDLVLQHLGRHFRCGTFHDSVQAFRASDREAPPLLALTFDDAQWDNLEFAAPVLRKHGLQATFFAPTGNVDSGEELWHDRLAYAALAALAVDRAAVLVRWPVGDGPDDGLARAIVRSAKDLDPAARDQVLADLAGIAGGSADEIATCPDWARMMNWDELRALQAAGHEIGSHSMTHSILPHVDPTQLRREIAGSKEAIEERLQSGVTSFCYPNGDYDQRCLELLAESGYAQACTTQWGGNDASSDPFTLRRQDITAEHMLSSGGRFSRDTLAWRMSGLFPGLPR